MKTRVTIAACAVMGFAGAANAGITMYIGHDANFTATDTAIFDDTALDGGGTHNTQPGITTHGMTFSSVHINEPDGFWGYAFPGGDGTDSCYFNGGQNDIMRIVKADNSDFNTVEMQIGTGWSGPNGFFWFTAWNNGNQVASFDIDATFGTIVGMTGGGFDEIRYQGYNDAATRNQHIETNYGAGAVDNVGWDGIPSPAGIALLGIAGLVTSRRRR